MVCMTAVWSRLKPGQECLLPSGSLCLSAELSDIIPGQQRLNYAHISSSARTATPLTAVLFKKAILSHLFSRMNFQVNSIKIQKLNLYVFKFKGSIFLLHSS